MDRLAGWEDHPYCYLTTTGRRTGRPHRIEIWFVVHDGALWLLTEPDGRADWVRNLRADGDVALEVGSWSGRATAAVVDLSPDSPVRAALAGRYAPTYDGDLAAWARGALAVRVVPAPDSVG